MGLKFIKGKWQAHLDKYLKLKLVEMVGWNPGLRKRQLEVQLKFSDLKTREIFPTSAAEQPDGKQFVLPLTGWTINAH